MEDSMQKLGGLAAILIVTGICAGAPRTSAAQAASSTKTTSTAFNACALLTTQEAATAVGEAVGEPKPKNPPDSAMPGVSVAACEFVSAARNSLQLTVWRPSADSAGMFVQIYKSECLKKEQVPGLGDIACWYSKDHKELQVLKGSMILTFEIRRGGNATEALTTVAKNALGRLK
jgi:hypothetical protein